MSEARTRSAEFRREREVQWRRLQKLVERVERAGIRSLSAHDLIDLPVLHRAAVSSLSVARTVSLDRNVLAYLEALTARSHFCVYGLRRRLGPALYEFFALRFPAAVRAARWHVAVAAAVTIGGLAAGFALTIDDPDRYYSLVPEAIAQGRDPSALREHLESMLYAEGAEATDSLAFFATHLFQHNTQVGILCFALGFAAGVPVFFLLFWNGLLLGAMSAVYHLADLGTGWWGWVLPHGVSELLAVVLCGAAGFLQGQAVVFPGQRPRLANLAVAGRRAGVMVVGAAALFLLAALIEGIFRQVVHSVPVRYLVIVLTAAVWTVYFTRAGRGQRAMSEP
jgi:uncharacterized membrane protein SpoIIM required for sporulation